jgi:hypothetical protein
MVVVCFPWFYFIGGANHSHDHPLAHYFTWLTNPRVSRPKCREKVEEATTLTLQSKANKHANHFNFFLSPRPRTIDTLRFRDRPCHHPQPQASTSDHDCKLRSYGCKLWLAAIETMTLHSFPATSKLTKAITLTLHSKAKKDDYHFNFVSGPKT